MTKNLFSIILAVGLIISPVKKSQAVVGLIFGNAPVVLVGLLSMYGASFAGRSELSGKKRSEVLKIVDRIYHYGVIMLNAKKSAEFLEIGSSIANKCGLTKSEQLAYNDYVPELNAISEQISIELGANATEVDSKRMWQEYKVDFSKTLNNANYKLFNCK